MASRDMPDALKYRPPPLFIVTTMLPSTPEEKQAIIDYMNSQAPDLTVEFLQKVYVENVLGHQHAVWDVHTNVDRWWVITNGLARTFSTARAKALARRPRGRSPRARSRQRCRWSDFSAAGRQLILRSRLPRFARPSARPAMSSGKTCDRWGWALC
jgi:hypothetical protein